MPHSAPESLLALARRLLPPAAKVAGVDAGRVEPELHPAEEPAAAGMTRARRREFAAGRLAARLALAELGVKDQPVRVGSDRAPVWPEGVVGSITHTRFAGIAVVARAGALLSLGIDLEVEDALSAELEADVLTPKELEWLAGGGRENRQRIATLIFSAKEATYKCVYPLAGRLLGFHSIEIRPAPSRDGFFACFRTDVPPFRPGDALRGGMGWRSGHVLTALSVPDHAANRSRGSQALEQDAAARAAGRA